MKITSSYKVKIKRGSKYFDSTISIYRNAVSYLIDVCDKEWEVIDSLLNKSNKDALTYLEGRIHTTKKNKAIYNFDSLFPCMPSYFRRAAINQALGSISSYKSNYQNWINNGKQGKEPTLQLKRFIAPVFYRGNMIDPERMLEGKTNKIEIKLFTGKTWKWFTVRGKNTDVKYLHRKWSNVKATSPSLIKKRGKYYLSFSYEELVKLSNPSLKAKIILAIDLGINTDATCCVMQSDGTVLKRKFINFPSEKDRIYRLLNRIKRLQRKHSSRYGGKKEWRKVKQLLESHSIKIRDEILDSAIQYDVDTIVFEHLGDLTGEKIKGSKK